MVMRVNVTTMIAQCIAVFHCRKDDLCRFLGVQRGDFFSQHYEPQLRALYKIACSDNKDAKELVADLINGESTMFDWWATLVLSHHKSPKGEKRAP
jgi:hypothetical protein